MREFIKIVEAELDPDNEARLQRARDMGYDVDDPHYFGTPNGDFDELDLDRTADENLAYGRGAYSTRDPAAASGYAQPGTSWGNHHEEPQPAVYKVFLKVKNPFDLDKVYPYKEIKRIFTHCFDQDELHDCEFWTELATEAEDYEYMPPTDDDDDEDHEPSDERSELERKLDDLEFLDGQELGIDPEDYEHGEDDEEYQSDLEAAIASERKSLERQIEYIDRREEQRQQNHLRNLETGRIASAWGKDIYRALWQNTGEYHDWSAETKLFGGDTGSFEFKTIVNRWLEELGYDGLRHLDRYNPGTRGQPHMVTIAFNPNQVRSAHAAFDPARADSPKLSEKRSLWDYLKPGKR